MRFFALFAILITPVLSAFVKRNWATFSNDLQVLCDDIRDLDNAVYDLSSPATSAQISTLNTQFVKTDNYVKTTTNDIPATINTSNCYTLYTLFLCITNYTVKLLRDLIAAKPKFGSNATTLATIHKDLVTLSQDLKKFEDALIAKVAQYCPESLSTMKALTASIDSAFRSALVIFP